MILTDLRITLMTYGPDSGKHVGTATFSGNAGKVELRFNEHHLEQIFETCADSIIETSRAAARYMTMRVIEQKTAQIAPPAAAPTHGEGE